MKSTYRIGDFVISEVSGIVYKIQSIYADSAVLVYYDGSLVVGFEQLDKEFYPAKF